MNAQVLVDSIPALIHTARPDGYLDYFNAPWLEYLGVTLDKVAGWNWTAYIHPEDVEGIVAKWRACLATGEIFEYETRVRRASGEYRWMFHRKVPLRDANGNIVKWFGSSLDIDERKTAEEQLRRNAEELQRSEFYLAEGQRLAHMGSWAFDPDGFYYWSPELFRMHGLDPASKPPSLQEYLDRVHPHDRESMADLIKGILAKTSTFDATKRIVRPNGEVRYIRCVGAPVVENQSRKKYVGSAIDVTEHEVLTQELRRREALLSAEKKLLEMIASGVALEEILTALCLIIEEQQSGTLASVLLLNPDGVHLRVAAGPNLPDQWTQQIEKLPIGPCAGSCGTAAYRRSPVIVSDIASDPLWNVPEHRASALKHGLRASWSNPVLSSQGNVLGTFCMYYREPRSPDARDLEIIEAATRLVEVAVKRDRAEESLRRSEAYLTEAQRLSHTGSFGWKPDTGEIVWSDETYRIFEYDRSVKPTMDSVVQRVHPQDRADFQKVIDGASRGAADFEHTYRLLLPDGQVKHVHAIAHALPDASGNREFVGAVTDITERKTAEEALRSSEAYLAEAQRLSHTGSWAWSPDTDVRHWSEECYRVLGFDPRDGLPRFEEFFRRIHPDDQPSLRELIETAIREKAEWQADYRIVHPNGTAREIHVVSHPVLSTSGHLVEFVGSVIDVTERKRAEEERRRSESELRQMLDLAPQHVVVFGRNRERLYANRVMLDYLGFGLEEWRQGFDRDEFVHLDDRERANGHFDRALSTGAGFELELRLRKGDGSYRWFLTRCNPVRDEQRQITRWYVACTDIEERKQAEQRLQHENVALREELDKTSMFEEIVGSSSVLQTVLSRVSKVAPTDSSVLITGETGTGKELVARAIHKRSKRSSRAFVSVNCAAIPRDLIASELFGHEKGAFTGATQRRLGRFELAGGGTIFLDEVGELPAETQIALLRVLQEHEFERVGANQPIRADVRVIAATNRDLEAAIAAGSFRRDLFYRLNVFPVEIPPLRQRKEDIPILVEYFIDRFARKAGKQIRQVNKKTLDLLQSYPWPGNIRELQNVIERSVIVCETELFSVDESWLSPQSLATQPKSPLDLSEKLAAQEKEMIQAALRESGGQVSGPSGAAAKLGMPRSTLESRIRSFKINKNRFKTADPHSE